MKKPVISIAVLALVLTACATTMREESKMLAKPQNPQVTIMAGKYIVVDQEPIVIHDKNVWIYWQLPDKPSPYRFPSNGIVITNPGDEFINCHVEQDGLRFGCFNKNSKVLRYKYTINVTDGSKLLDPLDPYIMND